MITYLKTGMRDAGGYGDPVRYKNEGEYMSSRI